MTLLLPTLAVAFAAFCVWLTVRIVNRRERWAKWTAVELVVSLPVLFGLSVGTAAGDNNLAAPHASPAPQTELRQILTIHWSRGPDLPQGFQDSDGGVLGSSLITVGGFCSGGLAEDNRRKPGRYPRGFLKKGWELDLVAPAAGWKPLPDFPGAARQGISAAVLGDAIYFWGGFSYTEPYSYQDGWRLAKRAGAWTWEALPELPWKNATLATAVIGTKIYAFGGADYDATAFYSETDRTGTIKRLGARLLALDTSDLTAGWKEISQCPGTPRWVNSFASVAGKLYVIGGASGDTKKDGVSYGYCTIVDNWVFDPATGEWSRLRDLPVSSGNFPRSSNSIYKDRFLLLPGGHQYGYVLNPDGSVRDKYGVASSANPKSGLHNDFFVYDTATNLFGTADRLPIDNNLPMTVVRGDEVFLLGGETGGGMVDNEYYGHHPDLFLRGRIAEPK